MTFITCNRCGASRPYIDFPLSYKKKKDGSFVTNLNGTATRLKICKQCKAISTKTWRLRNLNHLAERQRQYVNKNKFRVALIDSKKNAAKRGHAACSATISELQDNFHGQCDSCGILECDCKTRLHMDHNHETGAFRGWLCSGCNLAAGSLRNSSGVALKLSKYLERFANAEIRGCCP
jgi:hypothetical protein